MSDARTVTRMVLEDFVEQGFMFTALDVSNEVKTRLSGVRHRDISPLVREFFDEGVLGDAYTRTLIDVQAGGKTVQAYLYFDEDDDPDDYDGSLREQRARPPSQQSAAAPMPVPTAPQAAIDINVNVLELNRERDGSIEIPAGFLARAGIYGGTVHLDVADVGSDLVIVAPGSTSDPLAELEVDDVLVVPADRLSAYDGSSPITVRLGVRRLEISGTLR